MRADAAPVLLELALSREPTWRKLLLEGRESFPRQFRFVDWFGIQHETIIRRASNARYGSSAPVTFALGFGLGGPSRGLESTG
jgi:hypothetical protein